MVSRILVSGSGSFIARQWLAQRSEGLIPVSHRQHLDEYGLDADVVVNFSHSPQFNSQAYSEQHDCDLAAARIAATRGQHFVMLSTRKVYQPQAPTTYLEEHSPLGPNSHYGANKLESERRIVELLGERCTVLRVSNVYGFELGRNTFFGIAMTRLKREGRICLDCSPFTQRDFIPASRLAAVLDQICDSKPAGIYNVGSGAGQPLGRVAQWLIQGYGRGMLEISDVNERDGFVMNIAKLSSAISLPAEPHNFESDIKQIGKRLNDE